MIFVAESAAEGFSCESPRELDAPKEALLRDTGLVGLVILARFHNIAADPDQLAHDFRESGKNLIVPQILLAARQLCLKARQVHTDLSRLLQTPVPAIAIDSDGHFFARSHRCRTSPDPGTVGLQYCRK